MLRNGVSSLIFCLSLYFTSCCQMFCDMSLDSCLVFVTCLRTRFCVWWKMRTLLLVIFIVSVYVWFKDIGHCSMWFLFVFVYACLCDCVKKCCIERQNQILVPSGRKKKCVCGVNWEVLNEDFISSVSSFVRSWHQKTSSSPSYMHTQMFSSHNHVLLV